MEINNSMFLNKIMGYKQNDARNKREKEIESNKYLYKENKEYVNEYEHDHNFNFGFDEIL